MDWTRFNTHGESPEHAFEVLCNLIFKSWCYDKYKDELVSFTFINGAGGDGGVEAIAELSGGRFVGVQSKWFRRKLGPSQYKQIKKSVATAIEVRPSLFTYVICIPHDFTSKRKNNTKSVTTNDERTEWSAFIELLSIEYPQINFVLWDETEITGLLTKPQCRGLGNYWFDNTEISDSLFTLSFEKSMNGWANTKYIPDLFLEGNIKEKLLFFLNSYYTQNIRYEDLNHIIINCKYLLRAYTDLIRIPFKEADAVLVKKISNDIGNLKRLVVFLQRLEPFIVNGIENIDFSEVDFSLDCSISDLSDCPLHWKYHQLFKAVEEYIEIFEDEFYSFKCMFTNNVDNKLIILGNPGTGKTAGVVAEVDRLIREKSHLPILVHAKDFSNGDTWLSILLRTLGLSSTWDEQSLFKALESAALINNYSVNDSKEVKIQPKCVIFVDGIDESSNWEFWKERINEVEAYSALFPSLRFVFLSRPYVFDDIYESPFRRFFYELPFSGDADISKMFDKYIDYYSIDICGNYWIKELLRTPISIKLFCDLYKNSSIKGLDKNSLVITSLFQNKIEQMEKIYSNSINKKRLSGIINNTLCTLAELLISNSEISIDYLYKALDRYDKRDIDDVLNYLDQEGFIYRFQRRVDAFSEINEYLSWGMQPAFDYLIARKAFVQLCTQSDVSVPKLSNGIYQMLSIITIEEADKLLSDYPGLQIQENQTFNLIFYGLCNSSPNKTKKHREYIKQLMLSNPNSFRNVVNKVVIPVAGVLNHPLGCLLLDEVLRHFSSDAMRDIWWSTPANYVDFKESNWFSGSDIDTYGFNISLSDESLSTPLLGAWMLASLSNDVRSTICESLFAWGIAKPDEFIKLLVRFSDISDWQILENLFAIAYGIALAKNTPNDYYICLAKWILVNVFSSDGLLRYENVVIRYYCLGILRIALGKKLISVDIKEFIPPYDYEIQLPRIDTEAVLSERMGGYKGIDYDLSRYVLCDRLDGFFRLNYKNKKYNDGVEAFLQYYKEKYDLEELTSDGAIISIVYQFLVDHGWNEQLFYGYEKNEFAGVDSAIRRTYYHATHGAQSAIMTVCEKYVWLGRHYLEAILSNLIVFNDWENQFYIDNYGCLENFTNCFQLYSKREMNKNNCDRWFNINLLASSKSKGITKETISRWMKKKNHPNFLKWIENDGYLMISSFSNVLDKYHCIEETLWISSGVVDKNDFTRFLDCINSYSETVHEMITGNLCAYYNNSFSPEEACLLNEEEEERLLQLKNHEINVDVYKMATECTVYTSHDSSESYTMPSKLLRDLVGIEYGDGYEYVNEDDELCGYYYSNGENWGTQQEALFVIKDKLELGLETSGKKQFWIFRDYKSPSLKAFEMFPEGLKHHKESFYLVWREEKEIQFLQLDDLEEEFVNRKTSAVEDDNPLLKKLDEILIKLPDIKEKED